MTKVTPVAHNSVQTQVQSRGNAGSTLATGDGFQLGVSRSGNVQFIKATDTADAAPETALPLIGNRPSGGFSIRTVGTEQPLIGAKQDFASEPAAWVHLQGSGKIQAAAISHNGGQSIRIDQARGSAVPPASFQRNVTVKPSTFYSLSAWMKTQDILPEVATAEPGSPAQVQIWEHNRITDQWTKSTAAYGYTGSADWHRAFAGFKTGADTDKVQIRGTVEYPADTPLPPGVGTAWFDDVQLQPLLADHASPVIGKTTSSGENVVSMQGRAADADVSIKANYTVHKTHISVEGAVVGPQTTPLQVTYTLPVDAAGWKWHDNLRQNRTIDGKHDYSNLSLEGVQSTSVYPLGTISNGKSEITIAIPADAPRIARVEYKANQGLAITFDLGVSPQVKKLDGAATFSFLMYQSDPEWQMRSAMSKYYSIFSDAFTRRTTADREGAWYVRAPLKKTVDGKPDAQFAKDLGLGLNQIGFVPVVSTDPAAPLTPEKADLLRWDNAVGSLPSVYNHHWGFQLPTTPSFPGYTTAMEQMKAAADAVVSNAAPLDNAHKLKDEAIAAESSTARDYNGRLLYQKYDKYVQLYENTETKTPGLDWNEVTQKYQVKRALEMAKAAGGRLEGLHMDSTSGIKRWNAVFDQNTDHWATTTMPLTFSYDSGLVGELLQFPNYAHLKQFANDAHAHGMIMSANMNALEKGGASWFGIDTTDYWGLEGSLDAKANLAAGSTTDSFAMSKRAFAFQRPVSTLDNDVINHNFTADQFKAEVRKNLFYDIYPGMSATNTATVWQAEGRAVYKQYMPLFRELSAAGWNPVQYAKSSNENLWLERYGSTAAGSMHVAIRNETDAPQTGVISLSKQSKTDNLKSLAISDMVTGAKLASTFDPASSRVNVSVTVAPHDTMVLRAQRPADERVAKA